MARPLHNLRRSVSNVRLRDDFDVLTHCPLSNGDILFLAGVTSVRLKVRRLEGCIALQVLETVKGKLCLVPSRRDHAIDMFQLHGLTYASWSSPPSVLVLGTDRFRFILIS